LRHQYNPSINAFITITREQALAAAREMEAEQRAGKWRGPLHGIPIALKDNIDTAGIRTTAASGVFKDRVGMEDAEVASRLKKAGAILLGKLSLANSCSSGNWRLKSLKPFRMQASPDSPETVARTQMWSWFSPFISASSSPPVLLSPQYGL